MAIWMKLDVNLPNNPKVKRAQRHAGVWAPLAWISLLAINKANAFKGTIPSDYGAPEELVDWWRLDESSGLGPGAGLVGLMRTGLRACRDEQLVTLEERAIILVGWGPEWDRNDSDAVRSRRYRENQKKKAEVAKNTEVVTQETPSQRHVTPHDADVTRDGPCRIHRVEESRVEESRVDPIPNPSLEGLQHLRGDLAGLVGLPDNSRAFRGAIEERLKARGWDLRTDVRVDSRGDGYGGCVDIVANRGESNVSIEFDRLSPRQKSIVKLQQLPGLRVVILRGAWEGNTPDGVDAVIGMGVAAPSPTRGTEHESLLAKWGEEAGELWDLQEILRASVIPGSKPLKPTADRLVRVCERLQGKAEGEGASREDCEAVLRAYAEEARRRPDSAKYFNGETNWRPRNFDRTLGSINTQTPKPKTSGAAKPMARDAVEAGVQELS